MVTNAVDKIGAGWGDRASAELFTLEESDGQKQRKKSSHFEYQISAGAE